MSTFARVFAISAGVGIGAVVCLAALIWGWSNWSTRPIVRDTSAISARYLGLGISFPKEGDPILEAEVGLTNQTTRELRIVRSSIQVFVRDRDGSLRSVSQGPSFADQLFLPTKEEVAFTLQLVLNQDIDYKCKTPADTDNSESPEFRTFLESCLSKITGVTLFVNSPAMARVDFAIPTTKIDGDDAAKGAQNDLVTK